MTPEPYIPEPWVTFDVDVYWARQQAAYEAIRPLITGEQPLTPTDCNAKVYAALVATVTARGYDHEVYDNICARLKHNLLVQASQGQDITLCAAYLLSTIDDAWAVVAEHSNKIYEELESRSGDFAHLAERSD